LTPVAESMQLTEVAISKTRGLDVATEDRYEFFVPESSPIFYAQDQPHINNHSQPVTPSSIQFIHSPRPKLRQKLTTAFDWEKHENG
jgi:hypothetical protein